MKAYKIAAVCLVIVLVAGALAVTLGVPAGPLVGTISNRLEAATGYRLDVPGGAKLTFWPRLTFIAHDVRVSRAGGASPIDRFTAQSLQLSLMTMSVFSGRPHITEIALAHPVLHQELLRERTTPPAMRPPAGSGGSPASATIRPIIDRIVVTDGALVFTNPSNGVENSIEHIDLTASIAGNEDRLDAQAQWDDHPVRLSLKASALAESLAGQSVPVEFTFEAPDLLQSVTGAANIRASAGLFAINGLTGTIGQDRFNGSATVDLTSKPLVEADFDLKHLDFTLGHASATPAGNSAANAGRAARPVAQDRRWSDQDVRVDGLNFIDADIRVSTAEFTINKFHVAPVLMQATLRRGIAQMTLSTTGFYGGHAEARLGLDASGALPTSSVHVDLNGARALPLLSDVADFHVLDGRLRAAIDVRATGASEQAAISTLNGSIDFVVEDGEVRGINIAKMVRTLMAVTLSGWQETPTEKTDFTQFTALFRIKDGQAATEDLQLASPLVRVSGTGSADLVNRTLQFKLDPKLVASLQGQGGTTDVAGLGVPVVVEGSWSEPHIYPDIAGILENPDTAYAKLRALGLGLFGQDQRGGAFDAIRQGLGTLLDTSKDDRKDGRTSPGSQPSGRQHPQDPGLELLHNLLGR
jgi:AsmA protein